MPRLANYFLLAIHQDYIAGFKACMLSDCLFAEVVHATNTPIVRMLSTTATTGYEIAHDVYPKTK